MRRCFFVGQKDAALPRMPAGGSNSGSNEKKTSSFNSSFFYFFFKWKLWGGSTLKRASPALSADDGVSKLSALLGLRVPMCPTLTLKRSFVHTAIQLQSRWRTYPAFCPSIRESERARGCVNGSDREHLCPGRVPRWDGSDGPSEGPKSPHR